MTNKEPTASMLVDVTKGLEVPFRGAVEAMNKVAHSVRNREAQVETLQRSVSDLTTEKHTLRAELTAASTERDQLRASLDAMAAEFEDYKRRTAVFVQFVETKCSEFVDQDRRVDGLFLYQEASREAEPLRAPTPRFDQFRSRFAGPVEVSSHNSAEPAPLSAIFGHSFADEDFGSRSY